MAFQEGRLLLGWSSSGWSHQANLWLGWPSSDWPFIGVMSWGWPSIRVVFHQGFHCSLFPPKKNMMCGNFFVYSARCSAWVLNAKSHECFFFSRVCWLFRMPVAGHRFVTLYGHWLVDRLLASQSSQMSCGSRPCPSLRLSPAWRRRWVQMSICRLATPPHPPLSYLLIRTKTLTCNIRYILVTRASIVWH